MSRVTRFGLGAVALLAVTAGSFVVSARHGWLAPSDAKLRARYALPNSKFMTIDGQSIHYVDEGQGTPVVLVHGSFGSLRMWGDWAAALKTKYRVIRFDRPPMGLSGANPQGRYGVDREMDVIGKLTARLGIRRFVLAATSSGGESAAAYAATHPKEVEGVIFSNIAAGSLVRRPAHYPLAFRMVLWADGYLGGWHMPALWRGVFDVSYADPAKASPALVREWTDLNNRAQLFPRRPNAAGTVPFARTPADLAAIRVPALLLWSDRDPEVPLAVDGKNALRLLGSTDKQLTIIGNCGHMMPLECGPASAVAAKSFLDRIAPG